MNLILIGYNLFDVNILNLQYLLIVIKPDHKNSKTERGAALVLPDICTFDVISVHLILGRSTNFI
jgi:hypothetical protein